MMTFKITNVLSTDLLFVFQRIYCKSNRRQFCRNVIIVHTLFLCLLLTILPDSFIYNQIISHFPRFTMYLFCKHCRFRVVEKPKRKQKEKRKKTRKTNSNFHIINRICHWNTNNETYDFNIILYYSMFDGFDYYYYCEYNRNWRREEK